MTRIRTLLHAAAGLLCLAALLQGCRHGSEAERPTVALSIEPERHFAETLFEGLADVFVLVPPSAQPETFEPGLRDVTRLREAAAWFRLGSLQTEERVLASLPRTGGPEVISLADGLPPAFRLLAVGGASPSGEDGHAHAADPHYWCSSTGARAMVLGMHAEALRLFPRQKELLNRRRDALLQEVSSTDREVKRLLEKAPCRSFVIRHPSLTFFALENGLRQLPAEVDGKEPGPAALARLVAEARAAKVRVLLTQPWYDARSTERIAREMGARCVTVDPLNADWHGEMIHCARAIAGLD